MRLCLWCSVALCSFLMTAHAQTDDAFLKLRSLDISANSIALSSQAQTVTLTLSIENENPVSSNVFYLENLTTNEQVQFNQVGNWQQTENVHEGSFTLQLDNQHSTGLWFVSGLRISDSQGNMTSLYDSLEELIVERFSPFVSVAPNSSVAVFDAQLKATDEFSQTTNTQTSYLEITVQDAVEYELWLVPNAPTKFTDISFSDAISIAQTCSIFADFAKCVFTSSNNNQAIRAQVNTQTDDINTFGYSAFLQPNATGYESNWATNFIFYPPEDFDGDGISNEQDVDDDNDGVIDSEDLFPLDASESADFDMDGIGDNADTDDDNDGVPDLQDAFSRDPNENNDNDNDGLGDNADTDDDNDSVIDSQDAFPFDPSETIDSDADGIGDNADEDDDNDGGLDVNDAFPLDPTETIDSDGDGIGNNADTDDDNDSVPDVTDAFPRDASESVDSDQDGIGNNADTDDDNDGVLDVDDQFPLDPGDFRDNDQDGIGDNVDIDDDNDSVPDFDDAFPFNPNESIDTDNDGIGNNADQDDDNDGLDDRFDRFPLDAAEVADFDGDGIGNNLDNDDDNDGVLDNVDAFPFAVTEWFDTDNDGIGNNADPDNDNDGVDDVFDAFENDATETVDTDSDGIGNNADTDDDNDGALDAEDAFPLDATESLDTDNDGIGNNVDTDDDGDRVTDDEDLFPLDSSESADNDSDGIGNNSDIDDDNDGVVDSDDAFPFDANESADADADGVGDNADNDDDNDGFEDNVDAFPFDQNEWADNDSDSLGDNRDNDDDNDGVLDDRDAFPFDANENVDTDLDGIGNNSDTDDDNDGVLDEADAFPLVFAESLDSDGDGIGNNADTDDDNDGIVDSDDSQPLNASIGDDQPPVLDGLENFTVEASGLVTPFILSEPRVRDNNLNPVALSNNYNGNLSLGENQIVWTGIDFAGNRTNLTQIVTVVDTTAPEFPVIDDIEVVARGIFTDVSEDISVTAFDVVDGVVSAHIVSQSKLKSGRQSVLVQAQDAQGNSNIQEVFVNILPAITAKPNGFASPGSALNIPIGLSGNAPAYPVEVQYSVVGPVTSATRGTILIDESHQGTLSIDVSPAALVGERVWISLEQAVHADVTGLQQIVLDIDNTNRAPVANIKLSQNGQNVSIASPQDGLITLQAHINDVNFQDTHQVAWQVAYAGDGTSYRLIDLDSDDHSFTFEFIGTNAPTGNYIAKATISETNTFEQFEIALEFPFKLRAGNEILLDERDSDFDGLSDAQEGFVDADGDRIPDYLDSEANQSILPTGVSEQPLTTLDGYRLTLGDIVKLANSTNTSAIVEQIDIQNFGSQDGGVSNLSADIHYDFTQQILNFNVENLDKPGQSVPVVIPLGTGTTIPQAAVYRKFNPIDGWFTFIEDAYNAVMSASFDDQGNCPPANSTQYISGLTPGDTCILLLIQDGGPNDADLTANGIIKDPGVLAIQRPNNSPNISVTQQISVIEGETVRLDATLTNDVENDSLIFNWEQIGGIGISIGENQSPLLSFVAPAVTQTQSLLFRLSVFDGRDTSSTNITVRILNQNSPPQVAIQAHDSQVTESDSIVLNAMASDGDNDFLTYQWQQTGGPSATISGQNSQQLTIVAPNIDSQQSMTFVVKVFDGTKEVSATTNILVVQSAVSNSADDEKSGGSIQFIILILLCLVTCLRYFSRSFWDFMLSIKKPCSMYKQGESRHGET